MGQPKPADAAPVVHAPSQTSQPSSQLPVYTALLVSVIALLGTLGTGYFQSKATKEAADLNFRAAERSSDIKMAEIAVSILRAPITDEVAQIRPWAMDVIDNGNTRKFTPAERQALLKKPLPVSLFVFDGGQRNWLLGMENPCSKFRKNPDGSWTQTAPVDLPRGNRMEGNTFKGTAEAIYLDGICK